MVGRSSKSELRFASTPSTVFATTDFFQIHIYLVFILCNFEFFLNDMFKDLTRGRLLAEVSKSQMHIFIICF